MLCTEGLVKPDIVFFGESLPARFFQYMPTDFSKADLLIVMGTSLTVQPFASLIGSHHDLVHAELQVVLRVHREVQKPQQQSSCASCCLCV